MRSALVGWSKSLSNDVAADGVTVNMLLPGRIHTERVDELDAAAAERTGASMDETRAASRATIPAGRYGTVEEFAGVAAFLASQHASYVTGSLVRCDGGGDQGCLTSSSAAGRWRPRPTRSRPTSGSATAGSPASARGLDGADVIDAAGKLVLPGGIEAHCHIAQESATGGMTSDDYRSGSVSAAFGGNSCFVPFAAQHRGMGVTETLDLYDARATGASVIDWSYHLIVADPTQAALHDELPAAFARGITSFKVFMTYDLMRVDDRQFLDILTVARERTAP